MTKAFLTEAFDDCTGPSKVAGCGRAGGARKGESGGGVRGEERVQAQRRGPTGSGAVALGVRKS